MTTLERMAQAYDEARAPWPLATGRWARWDEQPETVRAEKLSCMRAALEVAREPTPEMVEASRLCTIRNSRRADPAHPFESPFTAQVDHILSEKP